VRCCYEAAPTVFGLYRHLRERGIACGVMSPSFVRGVRRRRPGASPVAACSRRSVPQSRPARPAFDDYVHALDLVDARIAVLERDIAALAGQACFADWSAGWAACAASTPSPR
jgi:hypothetical protein